MPNKMAHQMRIALDIDSTLHHYWDTLSQAARDRFGIDLPYEEQFDWGITRLKPKQLEVVIADTHSDEAILAGRPYPGAVETVQAWHAAGHYIHVTSHRAGGCHPATATWLEQIGLPYDDLYCSYDKVSRCVELSIDVLAGFHNTALPISAGAPARLPPIAVKLNGDTA